MRYLKRLLQYIYSIYGFAIFLFFMFLLLPLIIGASFFGKVRGGNAVYKICAFWADAGLFCWGMHHENIYEQVPDPKSPAVFVFNHISYIDIPILMLTFRKYRVRILAKAEISKVPVFGFIYKTATVMVDRSDSQNREESVKTLKSLLRRNISVVIAPEGTFNMTGNPLKEFYDGAFRIAIETGIPVKPVLFLDAFDRLSYKSIFSLSPGRSRSVFLEEICVKDFKPEEVKELKQKVYERMEAGLIKYKASWISKKHNGRCE
ncbi:MAG: lysophospholipid acyltransferase family protein [Ferruginibacter sp.]